MEIFKYGNSELEYIKGKDKVLGQAIDRLGILKRKINSDPFSALIESIISQQISSKAAETVKKRVYSVLGGEMTPLKIVEVGFDNIRLCGMTSKKANYIIGIAEAALNGTIDFKNLYKLKDEDIIEQLSSLHGVGSWTAEMLLIFSLNRLNVFSFKDLAIRRGIMNLYGLENITKKEFEDYRKLFSPYCSIASLYFWELSK